MRKTYLILILFTLIISNIKQEAQASSTPYLGEIMMFGGNYCPRGWVRADGSQMHKCTNSFSQP